MAQQPIAMEQVKQIFQLNEQGVSIREIVRRTGISRNSVRKYLNRLKAINTGADKDLVSCAYGSDIAELEAERLARLTTHVEATSTELAKTGVTRQLLWQEYLAEHPDGYSYSRYCHHLEQYLKNQDLSMHLEYDPGDMIMIDFAGKTLHYVDTATDEQIDCQVFVAVLPFSQYMDSVTYIPLETTKESLFGDIDQLLITDSSIIISDVDTKAVYFFSKKGKFLSKVKGINISPTIVKTGENRILITEGKLPIVDRKLKCTRFTSRGEKILEEYITENDFIEACREDLKNGLSYEFKDDNLLSNLSDKMDSSPYMVEIYYDNSLYKKLLPYNRDLHALFFSSKFGTLNKGSFTDSVYFFIVTPFDHFVYKINKDSAQPIFQIIFPASQSIPERFFRLSEKENLDNFLNELKRDSRIIININNLILKNSHLYFKSSVSSMPLVESSEVKNQFNFLYDFKTSRLSSFERIVPDSLSFFLPILDQRSRIKGLDYFNGSFYTGISSINVFKAMERNRKKIQITQMH